MMKTGKTVGLDVILVEIWNCLGEEGLEWLTKLFDIILRMAKMLSEQETRTSIPLYKNKGDIQDYNNY